MDATDLSKKYIVIAAPQLLKPGGIIDWRLSKDIASLYGANGPQVQLWIFSATVTVRHPMKPRLVESRDRYFRGEPGHSRQPPVLPPRASPSCYNFATSLAGAGAAETWLAHWRDRDVFGQSHHDGHYDETESRIGRAMQLHGPHCKHRSPKHAWEAVMASVDIVLPKYMYIEMDSCFDHIRRPNGRLINSMRNVATVLRDRDSGSQGRDVGALSRVPGRPN